MMSIGLAALLLSFGQVGLSAKGAADSLTATPTTDTETAARSAIAAQARAFSAAYVAGDLDALLDIYTDDAVAIAGARDPIIGREALAAYWQPSDRFEVVRHETVTHGLDIEGDIAIDHGIYRGATRATGSEEVQAFSGRYVIVWKRGEDGVWRMSHDMWAAHDEPR
ncbi:YybH family protein [Sphingomicrobium sediminis]|uniref:DUF4440 domain-containing protein n=1 Tax=Sphingomicrobium sediminis TaxID=2950949 RepID=A0A9X2EHT9_9SPHN|nr:DUF4440 domain-containing protein [Sphingomicrobium sediminis]MCM8557766.1 DUF4440 domain-containing protein [Sphingomicrobium sediminis]